MGSFENEGIRKRHSSKIAAVPSNSGPVPNARTWPTAPGRLVTHRATVSIQSMPAPISFQNTASKPNGMLAMPFGFDAVFWKLMGAGIDWMDTVALWVTSLPGAVGHVRAFGTGPLLLGTAAILLLCLLRIPSFSNDPINTGKRRQFEQHGREAFDQRPQAELRHHRYKFVEHGSLTKQRMSALF